MNKSLLLLIITILLALACDFAYSDLKAEIGTGAVFSGYHDVRSPGNSGTELSLSEDLDMDPNYFLKIRVTYSSGRHNIGIFASPVKLEASGEVDRSVTFAGDEFEENIPLKAKYRLNIYRLTYRYDLIQTSRFQAGLGLSARVEDGTIILEGSGRESEKENRQVIPLINFKAQLMISRKLSLILQADALALSQGRTEDILLAAQYILDPNISVRLGYRIFEGGVDIDELYNFRMLNYIVIGPTIMF